jgi:hypothetical protein
MNRRAALALAFTFGSTLLVASAVRAEDHLPPGSGDGPGEVEVRSTAADVGGAFSLTLTPTEGGPPPFAVLLVLTSDGGVVETDAGPPDPQQFSPGIGEWTRQAGGVITISYVQLQYDSDQNHIGNLRARLDVRLSDDGRSLAGEARVRFYDVGNTLLFEGGGTVAGSRIGIE